MASSVTRPRGFGTNVLSGSGHVIETDDGERYTSSSMNPNYVLSSFLGYANANPDHHMILSVVDAYGHCQKVAHALHGEVRLLMTIRR